MYRFKKKMLIILWIYFIELIDLRYKNLNSKFNMRDYDSFKIIGIKYGELKRR